MPTFNRSILYSTYVNFLRICLFFNFSVIGWVLLIQYLLLVKLFLTTLLTAMFSHTKAKVDAESDQIVRNKEYSYYLKLHIILNYI